MADMDNIVLPDLVYDGIDIEILSPDMIEHEQTCDQLDEIKYLVDVFQERIIISTCGLIW